MLAFHYMRAEDEEKSYEYLVKAGEEAMKSSASSEALNYYREALNLYINRYGEKANPEKVAMLEKNIALALFNWGQYSRRHRAFRQSPFILRVSTPEESDRISL